MSRPASKEKLVAGKRDAKNKSVVRDESFLRKPNTIKLAAPLSVGLNVAAAYHERSAV